MLGLARTSPSWADAMRPPFSELRFLLFPLVVRLVLETEETEAREDAGISRETQEGAVHGPQDVTSVRARSSGHGKKTADKWNQ